MDFDLFAWLHGNGERDGLETRDEVECAFFWDGCKALRGIGADGQRALGFRDLDSSGIRLCDGFVGL